MRPSPWISIGQALMPMLSSKARRRQDVVARQRIEPLDAPRFADADLRRDLDDGRLLEARHLGLQEAEVLDDLAPAFDLAVAQLARVDAVHRLALRVADLRDVGAPFARIDLRPQDRAFAREVVGARLASRAPRHQLVDGLELADRRQRARRIDMADAEHGRRERAPLPWPSPTSKGTPAKAATSASPLQSMKALARIAWRPDLVSTTSAAMRAPSIDARPRPRRGTAARTPACEQQLVGRALVGRDVVGAHADAALHAVLRLVEAAQRRRCARAGRRPRRAPAACISPSRRP